MLSRIRHSLLFRLEQIVMRGALARFGVLLGLVLLVAFGAGVLVRAVAPGFDSAGEAVWWAFLRLTDPGYLGDDEGLARATVATAVTVLGYIVTPRIASHMLARVAMRRELRAVFDELFSSGGHDIAFQPIADYGIAAGRHAFSALQQAADARGAIAIGIRWHHRRGDGDGGIALNPGRDERLDLGDRDELIVMSM